MRRITVAVLLNGIEEIGANGIAETVPRPDAEIAVLTELVRSAVGYDETRGDMVTIRSMAFDAAAITDLAEPGFADRLNLDIGQIVQTLLLALVALALAFGLVRPLLMRGPTAFNELPPLEPAAGLPALTGNDVLNPAALPMVTAAGHPSMTAATPPAETPADLPALSQMGAASGDALPMMMAGTDQSGVEQDLRDMDPVARLRLLIHEREEETVQILRSWMNEDEGAAG